MKASEAELLIIGEITSQVKKLFIEQLRALRSKGFSKVNLHVFTSEGPLKYLEELREPLLDNMITSIKLYEHNLGELRNWLERLTENHKDIIIIADEERLKSDVVSIINNFKNIKKP